MKKIIFLFFTTITLITSCSSNEDEFAKNTKITINFTHTWEGEEISIEDFDELKFVNENGETVSISRLRYLVSNIYVTNNNDITTPLKDYILVNLGDETNLTNTVEALLVDGTYDLYATFGFSDEDNYVEGGYADLSSETFDVPESLGGGYHYMQFEGKYLNEDNVETGFAYHAIRATDIMTKDEDEEVTETDTSYEIDLGEIEVDDNAVTITIEMDVAEWFTDTNTWDLNQLDINLMMNYEAQIMMYENVPSVFSLAEEEED